MIRKCPWLGCSDAAITIANQPGMRWEGCRKHLAVIADYLRKKP